MASNTVKRKYDGSDANLLQQANLNKTLLNDNLAAFTAEDETINTAYVTAYETDITEAEDTVSDEQVAAILQGKTATVKAAQKAVAAKVRQLRYYVLEAFPTDKEVQSEFGLDHWDKVRDSQVSTIRFLTGLHQTAVKYQTQLTAAGYGTTRTGALVTARQAMEDADNDQEHYRSGRPKLSALRVIEFNEVYDRLTRINSLAQIVFADDPDMAQQFVFNPSGSGGGNENNTFIGSVAAGEIKTIADITYNAEQFIQMQATGAATLIFSISTIAGTPQGSPQTVEGGDSKSLTMAQLNANAAAHYLQVENTDDAQPGAFIVQVGL